MSIMEKDLVATLEVAKKAGDAAAADGCRQPSEVDRCVNALKRLKKMRVTRKALIDNKVGKLLQPLKKHNDEKIKTAACNLFKFWQSIVIDQASTSKNNITSTPKENISSEVVTLQSELQVDDQKSAYRDEKGKMPIDHDQQKPNLPNSQTHINALLHLQKWEEVEKCNDKFRDNLRKEIAEALRRVWKETQHSTRDEVRAMQEEVYGCDPNRAAVVVERALYTDFENYSLRFRAKLRSIMFNLRDGNNPDFRRRVLIGQIRPVQIAGLGTGDMASDERKKISNPSDLHRSK